MMSMFNYVKTSDEVFNSLVETAVDLAKQRLSGNIPANYEANNADLNKAIAMKIVEGTRYAAAFEEGGEGSKIFLNPMVQKSAAIQENFNAVLAQITTVIVPECVNDTMSRFISEVHQVGWGETARFIIESNDLFKVNRKAEGVRKGVDQPMFDNEITVDARPIEISTHIDWYPFAAGVFDFGAWALKVGRSFAAYIFLKAIKGMLAATTAFGAAYTINGVTVDLFTTLKERVEAANGGMPVIAIGTVSALSHLSLQGNFQVEIGEEMNKVGYLDQYLGAPLIALHNVMVPGTVNGSATLAIDNTKIYLVPAAGQKPVKIVFEGNQTSVSYNPDDQSDKRYGITVEMRVGIEAVIGPKYGTINLQ